MQMDVVRPSLLPGEIVQGGAGRVARLNGCSSWFRAGEELFGRKLNTYWDSPDAANPSLLADIVGLPVSELNSRHTLKPLVRGRFPRGPRHSRRPDTPYRAREYVYYCRDCAREDLGFHGMSYWRREHQIFGMYWCLKHGVPLRYDMPSAPFVRSPAECSLRPDAAEADRFSALAAFPAIKRALACASEILDFGTAPGQDQTHRKVAELVSARRIRHFTADLSDLMLDQFGPSWLVETLPAFADKRRGEVFPAIDRQQWSQIQSSAALYIPLVVALTESVDGALNVLTETCGGSRSSGLRRETSTSAVD